MKAQADDLPTEKRRVRQEHLRLWYGSTWPNGPLVVGRLDGRLIAHSPSPSKDPSGRLFGCGLDGSVHPAIRASALSLSHIKILRHTRHKLGLVQRQQGRRRHFCSSHKINAAKPQRPACFHLASASFVSASLTNFDAQHSRVRRIRKEVANLLASGQYFARKYRTLPTTTPLHAHVVCICDHYVRAWWARRWRWWR